MERRDKFPMQNTKLCKSFTLREMEHNSPLLKYALCIVTYFRSVWTEQKTSNLRVEKSDITHSQVIKVNIKRCKSCC